MRHDEISLGYMPTLDGLRGFACMLVFFTHLEQLLNLGIYDKLIGSLGVLIFFSLSGFLMGALYFSSYCNYDQASKYVISRVSRIIPAYYLAIIFGWALYMIIPGFHQEMTPANLIRAFLFMGSEGVLWSIPPEIQFYGFFLLMWISYSLAVRGRYLLFSLVVILSLIFIVTRDKWGGILLPSKFHIFLFGFLTAILMKELAFRKIKISAWFQALLCFLVIVLYGSVAEIDKLYNSIFYAALVALMVMSLSADTIFTTWFKTPVMRFLGAASFSVYLFHVPIMKLCVFLIGDDNSWMIYIVPIVGIALPLLFHVMLERKLNVKTKNLANALNHKIKLRLSEAGFLPTKS